MFITSFLLVYLTDSYFTDTGIEFLNLIFSNIFLSILITSFGVIVTCNAWNFIDGVNGLSSGLGAFALLCLSFLSTDIDVAGFREFLRLSAFVFFGFFLINIITGRVFLGDTGSYFLGTFACLKYLSFVGFVLSKILHLCLCRGLNLASTSALQRPQVPLEAFF